jgi:hypothetical protein
MPDLFAALPNEAGMRVAIRRTLRVHEHEGMPLEDLGVVPDYKHGMTKDDLLKDNSDLINHAANILAEMPVYKLSINVNSLSGETLTVSAVTENISRLDVFLDDRPQRSLDIVDNSVQFELPQLVASFIELRGFKDNHLVAIQKIKI